MAAMPLPLKENMILTPCEEVPQPWGQRASGKTFKLIRQLTEESPSGYAEVWLASRLDVGSNADQVVLKVLKHRSHEDELRLRLEAVIQNRLHPVVPEVLSCHDFGAFDINDRRLYYLELPALRKYDEFNVAALSKKRGIGPTFRLLRKLAEILKRIHAQDILHRDLNPRNILVLEGDELKVIDFGLGKRVERQEGSKLGVGKLTPTDITFHMKKEFLGIGCPGFYPPDMSGPSARHDERYDIFSFGIHLFHFITEDYRPVFGLFEPISVLADEDIQQEEEVRLQQLISSQCSVRTALSEEPAVFKRLTDLTLQCISVRKNVRPASFNEVLPILDEALEVLERQESDEEIERDTDEMKFTDCLTDEEMQDLWRWCEANLVPHLDSPRWQAGWWPSLRAQDPKGKEIVLLKIYHTGCLIAEGDDRHRHRVYAGRQTVEDAEQVLAIAADLDILGDGPDDEQEPALPPNDGEVVDFGAVKAMEGDGRALEEELLKRLSATWSWEDRTRLSANRAVFLEPAHLEVVRSRAFKSRCVARIRSRALIGEVPMIFDNSEACINVNGWYRHGPEQDFEIKSLGDIRNFLHQLAQEWPEGFPGASGPATGLSVPDDFELYYRLIVSEVLEGRALGGQGSLSQMMERVREIAEQWANELPF